MISWQQLRQKWRKSHFLRFGLPFLTLVVGGSFMTVDFQRIKYEAQQSKRDRHLLEQYGINDKIDLKEEYEKISEANANYQWRNVRGPRPYEDNAEFLSLRESQERNMLQALERGEKAVQEKSRKVD